MNGMGAIQSEKSTNTTSSMVRKRPNVTNGAVPPGGRWLASQANDKRTH